MQIDQSPEPGAPWWKFPLVWMVIAGPAIVVVAGFATLWLALRAPDPLVAGDYYRRGLEINKTLATQDKALMPAVQGRNHAATPAPAPTGR
ncbi:MAG: FixH family protein [Polaromonas sp.]|uniref:FixH family protein n=1 Tax=Polaromonas sp. TaxID=1869339 RepID=UPI002731AD2B|nr:FixH family protein [Polaromonas sp.]MDP1740266.1 FixH family protein [Polaromonas sp.]MDP1956152.1 FixH family protein [Polaromonas sp.]MDP3356761.1 FixH family protein [Polaromonas sp.]MDP3752905.1 FixH family protein [Polaromonas sp.]